MAEYPAGFRPQGEVGEPGHEPTDIGLRLILVAGAILGLVCVCVFTLMAWMMRSYRAEVTAIENTRPPLFADRSGLYPEPRLQEDPHADLRAMRAADRSELDVYGWVDRKAGVVKIPIERAMEILAKRGVPLPGSAPSEASKGEEKPKGAPAEEKARAKSETGGRG